MKELPHELGWARVVGIPWVCEQQIVDADQLPSTARRGFVDDDLWPGGIEYGVVDQGRVDIVKPHGSEVIAAYTAELKAVSRSFGHFDVLVFLRGVANDLDQSALTRLLIG